MSTVRKSAQYYCRAFISINGRRINYKYFIATNSFMWAIIIFRLYIYIYFICISIYLYIPFRLTFFSTYMPNKDSCRSENFFFRFCQLKMQFTSTKGNLF